MTEYFIPKSGMITVAGRSERLIRGLHPVKDAIADSKEAIAFGIKTEAEMTDAEWMSIGREKPKAPALDGAVKTSASTATLDGAVRKVTSAE